MKTFIASDLHINHVNILKYCPGRRQNIDMPTGSDQISLMVSKMNELIVSNWNSIISQEDDVYILGDVAMGQIVNAPKFIRRLNGRKYLVAGNHDKTLRKFIKTNAPEYDDLFVWIKDVYEMTVKLDNDSHKISVFMSHYPHASWNHMNTGTIHFHGHTHGSPTGVSGRIMDVGIDTNDLFPYEMNSVVKKMLNVPDIRNHH